MNVPPISNTPRATNGSASKPTAPSPSASPTTRRKLLGDLVFVELPEVGRELAAGRKRRRRIGQGRLRCLCADRRQVTAVNQDAADAPESVNQDAYAAWLFKMKPANAADVDALLDAAAYTKISE
jgi:glycine cleavage system H protein